MLTIKNLAEASKSNQKKFIESFDRVLLDIDGVVWLNSNPIKGALECTNNLKKIGKHVHYVTNNTIRTDESLMQRLRERHFIVELSDIINPTKNLITYLKKLDIKDDIYVIGMQTIKNELKKNGFSLVPDPPATVEELIPSVISHNDEKKVGAVICDVDFNLSYIKISKAFWYLKNNPECIFIITFRDKSAPIGPKGPLLGTYHFVEAIQEISGKEYVEMGKPSMIMVNQIKETYKITEPNRVLFIGDSIQSDLATATKGGFQKLLVLSGLDTIEDIKDWQYPEDYKPEYYADNLGVLNDIIKNIYESK